MLRAAWIGLLLAVFLFGLPGRSVIAQEQHVKNGSFEIDSDGDGIPDRWRPSGLGPDDERVTVILEASSRAEGEFSSGGLYAVKAKFFFTDGTTLEKKGGFKSGTGGWRRESRFATMPKDVRRIYVSIVFNDHSGTAWFDQVQLWTP